jgi:hypothetical protein
VVELGAGYGVTTVWMGHAMKENAEGHIYAIDDSRDAETILAVLREHKGSLPKLITNNKSYEEYFIRLIEHCKLTKYVTLRQATIALSADELLPNGVCDFDQPVDLLFSDFVHSPEAIMDILYFFLPRMAECSSILIDSASTRLNSFLMLERLVALLNQGKVPRGFLKQKSDEQRKKLIDIVSQRQFRLMHLFERKSRSQNSTAWLRIEPADWRPPPEIPLH